MESNRINASNQILPSLLSQKSKTESSAPKFMQALAEAVETVTPKILTAEPSTLVKQVKPRAHLDLTSLNPVQTSYVPEPAALERIGKSRIVPFAVGG